MSTFYLPVDAHPKHLNTIQSVQATLPTIALRGTFGTRLDAFRLKLSAQHYLGHFGMSCVNTGACGSQFAGEGLQTNRLSRLRNLRTALLLNMSGSKDMSLHYESQLLALPNSQDTGSKVNPRQWMQW